VLEIRRDFGTGMITAFIRIEGKPFGLIANNPNTSRRDRCAGGGQGARFMQLAPPLTFRLFRYVDTPGFMVGPEAEKTAIVRHVARMF